MNSAINGHYPWQHAWTWLLPTTTLAALLLLFVTGLNQPLFLQLNSLSLYTGPMVWSWITTFGDMLVLFALVLPLVGRHPRLLWQLILCAIIATLLSQGIKDFLNMPRPPTVLDAGQMILIGESHGWYSFPSGHTTAAFTLAGLISMQCWVSSKVKAAVIIGALLVGLSRIAVGVHWPQDVLAGMATGWFSAIAGLFLADKLSWGLRLSVQRPFALVLLGVVLTLLFRDWGDYPDARPLEVVLALAILPLAFPGLRHLFSSAGHQPLQTINAFGETTQSSSEKRWIGALVRLIITGFIFFLIFRNVDFDAVSETIIGLDIYLLILGILFQLASTLLAGLRWCRVSHLLGLREKTLFYLRSYFKGFFFNQGLPTSIGGDAIRVLDIAKLGGRKRDAFRGVFIDRLLGLTGLLLVNLFANLLNPDLLPQEIFWLINLIVAAGISGFVLLNFIHRLNVLKRWRITTFVVAISSELNSIFSRLGEWFIQGGLATAIHLLSMIAIFFIGHSVGMEEGLLTFLVIVPPVVLLTLIPISLAGWGVREGAMIGLFGLVGADKTVVLSMSLLYGLVLVIASLPGLYVYLTANTHHKMES
ncbi:MAG: lysylphosphatidylglycerol synthase domain-containing protein [Candidatus Polarisedimenticolaceae bacterium]|nr:lysylphosphatidylglycerol synthase domain-containing protein [Candidatus Polarisedimenticolaceae bacterium]